ncbi:MAG: twin-arginine translocation pathway signal, partial [Candidatus Eremiobacteraeota bacterium]|nr:twin-arginine translocation pathway signal [Candidatus Eremiobacteraeota bacterium]
MKRSGFLLGAVSGLALVANEDTIFSQALAQTALPGLPGSADRVLVVINFQGGNDGLNTVVPFGMPDYYRYRPSIGVPQNDVLRIDDTVGLNPVLAPFKKMYDAGNVAIVQGVGYPDPDHSHF